MFTCSETGQSSNAHLRSLWWEVLDRLCPAVFCDIGALDGSTSITAKQKFPSLVVYAFEANPEVFGLHAASPDLAGIANRHIAICDTVGPMTVYAPRTLMQYFDGTQIVAGPVEEPRITGKTSLRLRNEDASYAQFEVFGTTLDAFISEESILASETTLALWIDAEGAADKS